MMRKMKNRLSKFHSRKLGRHRLLLGRLPGSLMPDLMTFQALWQMHPEEFHDFERAGRVVKTPRWQQAYGMDYHYSGRINRALPIPAVLKPFLSWSQRFAGELNGLLLNWYDGQRGHYIGSHRDSVENMLKGAPIVTISLGEERTFRLRPWPPRLKGDPIDLPVRNGTVIVMPWEFHRAFSHEVPLRAGQTGKRISITVRGLFAVPIA
jgi:alkylated DNA repair dioxygenase AlkB